MWNWLSALQSFQLLSWSMWCTFHGTQSVFTRYIRQNSRLKSDVCILDLRFPEPSIRREFVLGCEAMYGGLVTSWLSWRRKLPTPYWRLGHFFQLERRGFWKMEARGPSENMAKFYETTRRHIPSDSIIQLNVSTSWSNVISITTIAPESYVKPHICHSSYMCCPHL
jgi:hypothetical protein